MLPFEPHIVKPVGRFDATRNACVKRAPETGPWDWAYFRWVRLNVLAIVRNTSRSSVSNSVVVIRQRCCYNTAKYNETLYTVYPKKYAHGFCFAVLCCGYTLTDFPYPSGLLHWHCGNLTIAPVPAKQPWWIWINTSCEFIMNDCITTAKQSTSKPCAYLLVYTVRHFSNQGTTENILSSHKMHLIKLARIVLCCILCLRIVYNILVISSMLRT